MRADDAIYYTQQLAKTCRLPGLLRQTWGTHSLSSEGASMPRDKLTQLERDRQLDIYAQSHIPKLLDVATPYFVDKALCAVVQDTVPEVPLDARLHPALFKTKRGCLFFEKNIDMPPRRLMDAPGFPSHEPAPLSGFAWEHDDVIVILVHFFSWAVDNSKPSYYQGTYIGNIPLAVTPWKFSVDTLGTHVAAHNTVIATNPNEDDTNNAQRFAISARATVATLHLMDQVLTLITGRQVDRAARKRAVRDGWKHEPTVQVVTLRRVERINPWAEFRKVDWSCRWFVSEHWRVLHRGTPDERRVKVVGYFKGPADKPLKPPAKQVFAVTR